MSSRRALSIALAGILATSALAPAASWAQDRTASAVGFGGMSPNSFTGSQFDFGFSVGKELTPSVQVIGEFGRVSDMLPSLTAGLLDLTPYDVRVSALYGEGGL